MAKYLVTGGAGFIGTNLIKYLLEEKHQVIVLDNYSAGLRKDRLQKKVKYVTGDIRNPKDLDKVCKKIDGIFHLAALPRVSYSVEQPVETHDVNVTGTLNVLMAAKKHKVHRVVFASSAAVYGNQLTLPSKESLTPIPVSPYGLHKFIGEQYCHLFSALYGVDTVCLRFFNVYGPYFDPNGPYALVVGKFLKQVMNKEPMTIRGDGKFLRDYVHVYDIARAMLLSMTNKSIGRGEVINIGSGKPLTVLQLAKLIGGKSVFVPPMVGDPRRTEADISLAKKLLKWQPQISLEEGVAALKKEYGIN